MAGQNQLGLPLADTPDYGLFVPASRYEVGAFGRHVEGADVVLVTWEQALGIVGWGGRGLLHLDEGVLAAGDDQAVGILGGRGEERERTEPLLALANNGGIEGGWLLGGLAPES